ncbi:MULTISPECIES: hypothetical protein [Gammaproteobacteria]|uniref:hypothetical protein n=1 Tax=Gammaproteobacteria TaxID=1236 RepID=UPI004047181C
MPFKRYVSKSIRKGKKVIKKRYTTRTGGARINRIAKDLLFVKRKLNTEHKHIDYLIGSAATANVVAQYPTKSNPIILSLDLPVKGLNFNNRVGNQIKISHITSKFEFIFNNNTDLIQRTNLRVQLLFAKNASDVPSIDQLYELDSNNAYTPLSMSNTQEYGKFLWIKSHDHQKGYTQPTNRYPESNSGGRTADPRPGQTPDNIQVDAPATQSLNKAIFYSNKKSTESIKVLFKNLSNDVEQMKPYLLLRSDVIDANIDYDPIAVTGIIRMTYVDN